MTSNDNPKLKIKKISEFDPKTIVFSNEFKHYKNNEFIQKSLAINVKGDGEGEDPILGFRSNQERFSFGLKGFQRGEWTIHLTFGPKRGSVPGTKEHEVQTKELKVMRSIQKTLKNRVSEEMNNKKFLFLREVEDEDNGKEYSSYFKVLPEQTKIRIGNKSYNTEEDLQRIQGRAIDVTMIAFELGKISVCPKVVSVKPKLVYLLGKFRTKDNLHQDWGEIFRVFEDEEEED